ncbi:MAG TPA: thiopurine S-methyltransferase [Rhodocyclaceae bacterium]
MSGEDNARWLLCWKDKQIGFHQQVVSAQLMRFWPSLGLAPGAPVFVPLCGKSLDLLWLAQQGHAVIGVELSPIAVRSFFREHRLQATRSPAGELVRWQSGSITIYCGDFFSLGSADLGAVAAVYDRASLTALPEHLRVAYLAHLRRIVPADCEMLLLTTEDTEEGETEVQRLAVADEVAELYGTDYAVDLIHVENVWEAQPGDTPPLRAACKAYRFSPKQR